MRAFIRSKYFINFNARLLVQLISQALTLVIVPITSRALGPEKFGEIAFASTIFGYTLLILQFGFNQHIILAISQQTDKHKILMEIMSLKFYISAVILILLLAVTLFISDELSGQSLLIIIINISLITEAFNIGPYFFAREKMFINAITQGMGTLVKTILVILYIHTTEDVVLLAIFIFLSHFVDKGMKFFFYRDRYFKLGLVPPSKSLLKYFKITFDFGIAFLFEKASRFFIPLLIGIVLSKAELGFFNAANRLFSVGLFLYANLVTTFIPLIYKSQDAATQERSIKTTNTLFFLFLILGIMGSIFTFFASLPIVRLLLGTEFLTSASILKTWSYIIFLIPVSMLIQQILIGNKKLRTFLKINIFGGILTIVGSYVLVKLFAFPGAILSPVFTYIVYFLLGVLFLMKERLFSRGEYLLITNPVLFFRNITGIMISHRGENETGQG